MITTKIRRFDLSDGKIVMTPDRSGEFFHINDIELWLREKKRLIEDMRSNISVSDWDKLYYYGLDKQIEFIDMLINEL